MFSLIVFIHHSTVMNLVCFVTFCKINLSRENCENVDIHIHNKDKERVSWTPVLVYLLLPFVKLTQPAYFSPSLVVWEVLQPLLVSIVSICI